MRERERESVCVYECDAAESGAEEEQEQEQVFTCSRKFSSWVSLQYLRCSIYLSSRHAIRMTLPATILINIIISFKYILNNSYW